MSGNKVLFLSGDHAVLRWLIQIGVIHFFLTRKLLFVVVCLLWCTNMGLSTSIFHKTLEANPTQFLYLSPSLGFGSDEDDDFFLFAETITKMVKWNYEFITFLRNFSSSKTFLQNKTAHGTERKSFLLSTRTTHERICLWLFFRCHYFQIRLLISTNALRLTTQNSFPSERQKTT